jgi:hypothetical protein
MVCSEAEDRQHVDPRASSAGVGAQGPPMPRNSIARLVVGKSPPATTGGALKLASSTMAREVHSATLGSGGNLAETLDRTQAAPPLRLVRKERWWIYPAGVLMSRLNSSRMAS